MIKTFKHSKLKKYFYRGEEQGLDPNHIGRISDILDALNASHQPQDMKELFGSDFSAKVGSGEGVYSVKVNGNFRITFEIDYGPNSGAVIVDYGDYHGKTIRSKKS